MRTRYYDVVIVVAESYVGDLHFAHVDMSDMQRDGFLYKCNVFNPYLDMTTTGAYSVIRVQRGTCYISQYSLAMFVFVFFCFALQLLLD